MGILSLGGYVILILTFDIDSILIPFLFEQLLGLLHLRADVDPAGAVITLCLVPPFVALLDWPCVPIDVSILSLPFVFTLARCNLTELPFLFFACL